VPIITNQDKDRAILQIVLHVNEELSKHFGGTPAEAFGELGEALFQSARPPGWRDFATGLAG
jgi:hypothetical protein